MVKPFDDFDLAEFSQKQLENKIGFGNLIIGGLENDETDTGKAALVEITRQRDLLQQELNGRSSPGVVIGVKTAVITGTYGARQPKNNTNSANGRERM